MDLTDALAASSATTVAMDVRTLIAIVIVALVVAFIVMCMRDDRPGRPKDGPW